MNQFQIEPKQLPKDTSSVRMWMEYSFFQVVGRVIVQFLEEGTQEVIATKFIDIPQEIYSQWTDSDQFLIDYVCQQLQITLKQ